MTTATQASMYVANAPAGADRTVTHGTFVLERTYHHSPKVVFDAWATRDAKNAWFGEGDDFLETVDSYSLDFRIGGREHLAGRFASGKSFEYDSTYGEILADRRIVAMYDVLLDGRRLSVSLLTVEFEPVESGTHLIMTEQGAFLDGLDSNEARITGAEDSLVQLDHYLARHS
jgi:uncharacterized protein YndB with AHSA1/START domain